MSEYAQYEYKDEKEFDKIAKIYLSSIFARKHKYIYLDNDKPNMMICSTISPDRIFAEIPKMDDVVHHTESHCLNFIDFWKTKLELPKEGIFCISFSGMQSLRKKGENDSEKMAALLLNDTDGGYTFSIKLTKKGNRKIEEQVPCIYTVGRLHLLELIEHIKCTERWVNDSPHKEEFELKTKLCSKSEFATINIEKPNGFGQGINLPFTDAFNTVSLVEYTKHVGVEGAKAVVGHNGWNVTYFCICDDKFAVTRSVIPKAIYYSKCGNVKDT